MSEKASATFQHYGLSSWEIEVIYDTLSRSFHVDETQLAPDDPQYVSMIEIGFPLPYDESFFQTFSMESWHKVKGVIKDIKRRRGRKGLKALVSFEGKSPSITFPLLSKGERQFEMGIEKLEYLVDIVPIQLKSIPPGTLEVWFAFDEASYKWSPSVARNRDEKNYVFRNNDWKSK